MSEGLTGGELSDRWLREEEKKSGRRLHIGISVVRYPTFFLPAIFRAKKFLTKNWHGGTLLALWTFLA